MRVCVCVQEAIFLKLHARSRGGGPEAADSDAAAREALAHLKTPRLWELLHPAPARNSDSAAAGPGPARGPSADSGSPEPVPGRLGITAHCVTAETN